jgi:Protein of unknown function (DUF1566)
MRKTTLFWLLALMTLAIFTFSLACGCGDDDDDEDTNDDTADIDDDTADIEVWEDPTTDLMWQLNPTGGKMHYGGGKSLCRELILGDYDDWRLPTISELRSLIRGCPATETSGSCNVTDSCKVDDCSNDSCFGCDNDSGPGPDGEYWHEEFESDCSEEGCFDYWSQTLLYRDMDVDCWYISFNRGRIRNTGTGSKFYVRCVRGAQN